jgi:hypothetical protein
MRVSRIQFDESESSESVASRIACAFDPGNILKIRDYFFKMSPQRVMNQTVAGNVVGDNYTLILNPGEPIPEGLLKAPPPPVVQEPEPEEADWDVEDPVESIVEPEPVPEPTITEPIKVESEPVAEIEPPIEEVLEEPVDIVDHIDFGHLAALPPELSRHDIVEAVPVPPPSDSVPPPSQVFASKTPPSIDGKPLTVPDSAVTPTSESGEYRIELPKSKVRVEVGQVWQSKDTRRPSLPFVVVNIDGEFVYQDNGRKISLDRMFRYKRVS